MLDVHPSPVRTARHASSALVALLFAACAEPVPVLEGDLAVTDVTVIDGNGGPALPGRTVLIAGGRIVAVEETARTELSASTDVLDGSGRYLLPGLWDMHVHAWGPSPFSELFLRYGITSVREMGTGIEPMWGGSAGVWDWREGVRTGEITGPRVYAPGLILNGGEEDQQGAPFFKAAPDPESGRRWVDTLAKRGADFIKLYSALAPDTFAAIAERADAVELTFSGHVPSRVGTREAVASGMRSLEHLHDLLVATSSEEAEIRAEIEAEILSADSATAAAQVAERSRIDRLIATYDSTKAAALFAHVRDSGSWISPTLVVAAERRCPEAALPMLDEEALAETPGFLRRFVQLAEIDDEELGRRCRRFDKLIATVAELDAAGVPLLAGSDSPNPGSRPGIGLHEELYLLVRAGLAPARVVRMATRDAAEFMGAADNIGTVEPQKAADLLLLDADPLEDIRNTRRIVSVLRDGEVVWGEGLASPDAGADATSGGN